ncbi:hypothetical protein CLF_111680 [Clonorchis sinensis]|uniref:CCHC-type domain-containing protein n=1 Tax=Clonorchis sinensis TaxID=79923 RepID=G7YLW1_CLOSI|nr:hypothetical protein CLF_111680 [Clonorchis sinensis]
MFGIRLANAACAWCPVAVSKSNWSVDVGKELVHLARELADAPLVTLQSQEKRYDSPVKQLQTKVDQLAKQLVATKTESWRHARTSRCYKCGIPDHRKNQCRRTRPLVNNKTLNYSSFLGGRWDLLRNLWNCFAAFVYNYVRVNEYPRKFKKIQSQVFIRFVDKIVFQRYANQTFGKTYNMVRLIVDRSTRRYPGKRYHLFEESVPLTTTYSVALLMSVFPIGEVSAVVELISISPFVKHTQERNTGHVLIPETTGVPRGVGGTHRPNQGHTKVANESQTFAKLTNMTVKHAESCHTFQIEIKAVGKGENHEHLRCKLEQYKSTFPSDLNLVMTADPQEKTAKFIEFEEAAIPVLFDK